MKGTLRTSLVWIAATVALAAAAQAGIYESTVLNDNPLAYWRLDESSFGGAGDAADATGNGRDGTYTNTGAITLGQAGPRPADGFAGLEAGNTAPLFAGSGSGNVTLPAAFLPAGNAPRTFTGWFNNTTSTQQNWFNYGQNSQANRVSITAGNDRVSVAVHSHDYGLDGLGLPAGWHHVAVVLPDKANANSADWRFYVDGVDRTSEAVDIAASGGPPFVINTIDNAARRIGLNVGGRIDEMAVFDRALSAADVSGHYKAALGTEYCLESFAYQTAADNGESPATSGQFAGPLYVRERGNESDPQLEVRAFLTFDLSDLGSGPIESAVLKLHEFNKLNNVNSAGLFIARVTEDWDPVTNKPTFDQAIDPASEFRFGDNGPAGAGAAVDIDFEIDITDILRQWKADPASNYGFRLRIGDSFVGAAFDDAGESAPRLCVSHVPEPATLALLGLALAGLGAYVRRRRA